MRKGVRCSRGPVTPADTANTTAEGASEFPGFLNADFADESDEESPSASPTFPALLFEPRFRPVPLLSEGGRARSERPAQAEGPGGAEILALAEFGVVGGVGAVDF